MMKLYNFWRSGTSHRLRIALNLKGIETEYVAVNLGKEQHLATEFFSVNPQQLVPALVTSDGTMIQSPAIIEWLEEKFPNPPLLPTDAEGRAKVRALAAIVGCDVHPINNRRVLEYLRNTFAADTLAVNTWFANWISAGFDAFEQLLASDKHRGRFSYGDSPTVADCYLIPQIESARRFQVDLSKWELILRVEEACLRLPAFINAAPSRQPDAIVQ